MTLFIADATVTLLRRMLRGEKWYEPHRSHAYQILSRRWHSHRTVSILFWTVNLLLVLPVAVLSVLTPQWAVPLAVVLFAGAAAVFWLIGAGDEPREGV